MVRLIDFSYYLAEWTSRHTTDEVLKVMEEASVPAGKIYDAQDIVEDEHINARGMIETVTIGSKEDGRGWDLKVRLSYQDKSLTGLIILMHC